MSSHHTFPVSPIDENHLLYGNFIGLQYVFESALDVVLLELSINELARQLPALSGAYASKSGTIRSHAGKVELVVRQTAQSLQEVLALNQRPPYIHEPKRRNVLTGRAPLSTFTLTPLSGGGVVLGVAISHVLMDAAGCHLLLKQLGKIYTALLTRKPIPEFNYLSQLEVFRFGTDRSKTDTLSALKNRNLPKPIPIKGIFGRLVKSLIIKAMNKSLSDNPPTRFVLKLEDVARLKDNVLTESGEDWISTNVALCAHFTKLMAMLSYGSDPQYDMQIGQLLDLRGRYFNETPNEQTGFLGNAILIHIDKAAFPKGLQNTSRGEIAKYFKHRQAMTTAEDIKDKLDLLADALRHGYTNPELDVKRPIISLNNQSKMPVYDLSFGMQNPMRVFPQDVGDNIMFFPGPEGSLEVYIRDLVNPMGQKKLLAQEWQAKIYDG